MKTFGSGKISGGCSSASLRSVPKNPPVLVNTDYEKRLQEFDKAFDHLTREIQRRDDLIRNLSKDETTTSPIDVSLIRQIINEELNVVSPRSERIDEERKRESVDEEFAQTLKEQNDSLAKISNDVTLFEEILKNKMNASQREPAYLRTTKAMECRKSTVGRQSLSVNEAKKKKRESVDRWH